jgi:hypothetical protein
MSNELLQLSDKMYCTIEVCPIDYFGSDIKRAERVTTFWNDQKVSTWDVYLSEDTRYTIRFEAEPEFQNGRWMQLTETYYPNILERFSRPNIVWLQTNQITVSKESDFLQMLTALAQRNVMSGGTIYAQGLLNKITHMDE